MENFFLDNEDILFRLKHVDLSRVVELREENYKDKDTFAHAPANYEDAMDSYHKILSLVGQISAEHLAPFAAEVDEEGVKVVDGDVVYAKATAKAMKIFAQADLMGFSLPRRFGGLNCPTTILVTAAEIVNRGDGSFLNFGLQQDNAETINKFASEEQKMQVLPRLCRGEEGSAMVLTEPDAGSDLQAVNLKATMDEHGKWKLNGVKRFITNGCGKIGLVLARSEEGTKGAGGLSFFLYERDEHMIVRRVEHKLGIHGSPTCELQFNNAPCTLIAQRRRGLTKYTMWLMNMARIGIAAQALGIAEAAYREARKYAGERIQFDKAVIEFPAVYELLTEMKVSIEAGRALMIETAIFVDMKDGLEHFEEMHPERAAEVKNDLRKYTRLAALYTPLAKMYNTENANKVSYDAIQIHGGTGYMKEFNVERHARDARITNIYEGTTQLQVVAAIGGVTSGVASSILDEYEAEDYSYAQELAKSVKKSRNALDKALVYIKGIEDQEVVTYHSRRLVEMTNDIILSYLLLRDAKHAERKLKVAEVFIQKMIPRVEMNMNFIMSGDAVLMKNYKAII